MGMMGGAPGGGAFAAARGGAAASGLPFAGIPPELKAKVDDLLATEPDGAAPEVGPAQPEERASVTPTAGGPERTPLTVAYHELDVQDGFDNAVLVVSAVPSMSADIDLYLQRQEADGTWSSDLASGATGSLTEEGMTFAAPEPGRYRVEVHNWAGVPATRVDLTMTYLNSAGEPGPSAG